MLIFQQTVELYYSKNAGYSLENLGHLLLITLGTIFTCGMFVFACFPELSAVASFKKNFMAPPSNVEKSAKADEDKWEDEDRPMPKRRAKKN